MMQKEDPVAYFNPVMGSGKYVKHLLCKNVLLKSNIIISPCFLTMI
jgi:hypothetical protein